jgi:hypothetical protein
MSESEFIKTANGSYGHTAEIDVYNEGTCDLCKAVRPVLTVDTSQQEYAQLYICQACITERFARAAAEAEKAK